MLPVYLIFYVLVLLQLVHVYPALPETISTRFDSNGTPLRTMTKDEFAMFHLGFVAFMSGSFAFVGYLVGRMPPKYVTIPNKDYWLAKSRRAETMKGLKSDICWMGIIVGAFVLAVDYFVMDAAIRNTRTMTPETLSKLVTAMAVVTGLFMARLLIKFRRPVNNAPPPEQK
jgi:uncharacterized membrane protein